MTTGLPLTKAELIRAMDAVDDALSELRCAVEDGDVDDAVEENLLWVYNRLEQWYEGIR